jgi:hypothetical protein
MDADEILFSPGRRLPMLWSLCAGGYAFGCAAALVSFLGNPVETVATALTLPADGSAVFVAAPAAAFGAVGWWVLVERRRTHSYLAGGAVGLVTALLTVAFWTVWAAAVWGPRLVPVAGLLVGAALAVSLPVGVVAGVPLMIVRRRVGASTAPTATGDRR